MIVGVIFCLPICQIAVTASPAARPHRAILRGLTLRIWIGCPMTVNLRGLAGHRYVVCSGTIFFLSKPKRCNATSPDTCIGHPLRRLSTANALATGSTVSDVCTMKMPRESRLSFPALTKRHRAWSNAERLPSVIRSAVENASSSGRCAIQFVIFSIAPMSEKYHFFLTWESKIKTG